MPQKNTPKKGAEKKVEHKAEKAAAKQAKATAKVELKDARKEAEESGEMEVKQEFHDPVDFDKVYEVGTPVSEGDFSEANWEALIAQGLIGLKEDEDEDDGEGAE